MNKSAQIPAASEPSPARPARNAAVQHCCQAYEITYKDSRKKDLGDFKSRECAAIAYRNAMPYLSGYENIRDFIACTAQAMLIDAIDAIEGAKFLYAAQVALGALRYEPKQPPLPPSPVVTKSQLNSNPMTYL